MKTPKFSMPTVAGMKESLFSTEKKTEDGRDQWGSRTSYVLASMGGAVGFGNLLRYPSQGTMANTLSAKLEC